MVRRSAGLFVGFDLENNISLRELATALKYWLSGGRDRYKSPEMKELSPLEQSTVEKIAQRMANSPLLTDIITPFVQAPRMGGAKFLTAARDLAEYAVPEAEEPRAAAYQNALAAWQNRFLLRVGNNVLPNPQAQTPTTMTEAMKNGRPRVAARSIVEDDVDTNDEQKVNKKKKRKFLTDAAPKASKKHVSPNGSGTPLQCRKSTRLVPNESPRGLSPDMTDAQKEQIRSDQRLAIIMQYDLRPGRISRGRQANGMEFERSELRSRRARGTSPEPPSGEQRGFTDSYLKNFEVLDGNESKHEQEREDKAAEALKSGVVGEKKARAKGTKGMNIHAPKKTYGDIALNDGTVDFKSAVVGIEDLSKLDIDFDTTRSDPKNPGKTIPGDRVYNRYHHNVDFNDKESVARLNKWRYQILSRKFPPTRRGQEFWLQSEKETALKLMNEQLERHKNLKWNRLTNAYNRQTAGVTQRAGEKFVASGNRKSEVLKEDRQAPWRTKSSLMNDSSRWQEYTDLVEAYARTAEQNNEAGSRSEKVNDFQNRDNDAAIESSEDEEEIPDPGLLAQVSPKISRLSKRKRQESEEDVEEEDIDDVDIES